MANSLVVCGYSASVRVPISWVVLLAARCFILSWIAGGGALWICVALGFYLAVTSEDISASDSGIAHPKNCLTRRDMIGSLKNLGQRQAPFVGSATSEAGCVWAPDIRLRGETREVEVLVRFRFLRGGPRDDLSCQ